VPRKFTTLPFEGIWDESVTPKEVGGSGMTSMLNLVYRRYRSWGKRSGSATAYTGTPQAGGVANLPVSGIRWYGSILPVSGNKTQTVVVAQQHLFTGTDPNIGSPTALTDVTTFSSVSPTQPAAFAPIFDPLIAQSSTVLGTDNLVICGPTITGFTPPHATAIFGLATIGAGGETITVTVTMPTLSPLTVTYTLLASDNPTTIGQNLVQLLNNAIIGQWPGSSYPITYLSTLYQVYYQTEATNANALLLFFNARGAAGNGANFTLQVTVTGAITGSPSSATAFSNGSGAFAGPLEYGGGGTGGPRPLSPQITNAFTGCVQWHNHVWYWGDPNNPDVLYASDINQPQGFTFMQQFGGYTIGQGDGDPGIQSAVPIGNILYVFKTNSIYAITGYSFQSGEYQFSVEPAIAGYGIPSSGCVAVLNNALVLWTGNGFYRLAVGAYQLEYIGAPIAHTEGLVALGNQQLVRAVAGDFAVQTALVQGGGTGTYLHSSVALWAVDLGDGTADVVLMYDDDASNRIGNYAWSKLELTALNDSSNTQAIGAWIPFGHGFDNAGTKIDPPTLFWIPPPDNITFPIVQYGANAFGDNNGTSDIAVFVTTGWFYGENMNQPKKAARIYLDVQAVGGATFGASLQSAGLANGMNSSYLFPSQTWNFPTTVGTGTGDQYQTLLGLIPVALQGTAFQLTLSEINATSAYELVSATFDFIEEDFPS
jgi:hypothetical protein